MKVLKLYPNVIPVKGYNRSTLIDLLNGKPYLVPNDLIDYIELNENAIREGDREDLLNMEHTHFQEYRDYLIENELGLLIEQRFAKCMTPLPLDFHPNARVNNVIFELDSESSWDLTAAISQLDQLGAQFMEVRFLDFSSFKTFFYKIKELTQNSTFESIQFIVPYHEELAFFLEKNLTDFFRLSKITIYNCAVGFELTCGFKNMVFTRQKAITHENCGNISPEYFTINIGTYIQNKNSNSCLAYKVSVDKDGFIKNCPSITENHGHVNEDQIAQVINHPDFIKKWEMTKELITICSVCEFRTICVDCRAFTKNNLEDSKPSKCGYNPYISLWSHEENYLTEEQCGVFLNDSGLHVDHQLLEKINLELWA